MKIIHNSWKKEFKIPFGAISQEKKCVLSIQVEEIIDDIDVYLVIYKDGNWNKEEKRVKMYKKNKNTFSCEISFNEIGYYFYYFELYINNTKINIVKGENNEAIISEDTYHKWQITVYDKKLDKLTTGLENAIMYQIFPDSFYREKVTKENIPKDRIIIDKNVNVCIDDNNRIGIKNNTYYGGNLKGIIKKLDYLKNIGIDIIYLNPIFEAHSNHRYNTADFMNIDPLLGNNEDFMNLCKEAHKRGMFVILDGVFNHVGADSIYFNKFKRYTNDPGAYNSKESKYYEFFKNSFKEYPDKYEGWWGDPFGLPEIDKSSKEYIEFICGKYGVVKTWIDRGADGFRLDVIDELPNDFINILCKSIREYGGKIIIGEVWEDATEKFDKENKRREYLLGNQIDSVMNYPFTNNAIYYIRDGKYSDLYDNIMKLLDHYPKHSINLMMNSLSTHDIERVRNRLANEGAREFSLEQKEYSKKLLKLLFVMQYTFPGIPCIYYGDEKGMFGRGNLENRGYMKWDEEAYDLTNLLIILAQIKKGNKALIGNFEIMHIDSNILVYKRWYKKEELVICINRSFKEYDLKGVLNDNMRYECIFSINNFNNNILTPYNAAILKINC